MGLLWDLLEKHRNFHLLLRLLLFLFLFHPISIPIGSMYGIHANIGGILMVDVTIYTIYTIHGSYGYPSCRWWRN